MAWTRMIPAAALAAGALTLAACGGGAANTPAGNAPAPANTAAAPAAAPFTPVAPAAPATVHFVNQMPPNPGPGLEGHMADFSFDYPSDMKVVPGPNTWIQVAEADAAGHPQEVFVVLPVPNDDQSMLQSDLTQLSNQLAGGMPSYQEVDRSATTFGGWPAVQIRFSAAPASPNGQRTVVYGRIVIVPGFAGTNSIGVMLMSVGSPAVRTVDDLSTRGDLATIASSFKMGK